MLILTLGPQMSRRLLGIPDGENKKTVSINKYSFQNSYIKIIFSKLINQQEVLYRDMTYKLNNL